MQTAAKRIFISPFLWGAGFCFAWKALISPYAPSNAFGTFLQVIVPLLVVLLWKQLSSHTARRAIVWLAALCGTGGTILLYCVELGVLSSPVAIVHAIASWAVAAVYILLFLFWSEAYARMNIASASIALSSSYLFGALLYFSIAALPNELHAGASLALPIMSASFLTICLLKTAPNRVERKRLKLQGVAPRERILNRLPLDTVPWRIVAVVTAFSFAAGVNRTYTTPDIDIFAAGIAGFIMLLVTILFSRRLSVFSVYKIALPIMMIGLIVGMAMGERSVLSLVCINASYAFAMMMLILLLCDKAHRFASSPIFLNAVARCCTGTAIVLGIVLGEALALATGDGMSHIVFVYAITISFVVLATFFWLSNRTFLESSRRADEGVQASEEEHESQQDAALMTDSEASQLLRTLLESRCTELSQEYHLSSRESEVLLLLAWGKSTLGIERALTISNNTVKTHVRNIYSKLGIHSRGELDALIGIEKH